MPDPRSRPVALVVLDGWGYRAEREGNAIALANTPTWDALWQRRARTLLHASGRPVGLPDGQMGNSEVGHLNLGAGRVVMQDMVRITAAIEDRTFFDNPAFVAACDQVKANGGTLHLLGLVGKGGVHALDQHLFALIDLAERRGVPRVAIHAMLDGRDTLPKSGLEYLRETVARAAGRATVASLGGRYYGMDRDKRWPRVELEYRAAVDGVGPMTADPVEAIRAAYDAGTTDEFILPAAVVGADGAAVAPMRDGDAVICWNYRSDRMRQLVRALADPAFDGFDVSRRPRLSVVTMTVYDPTMEAIGVRAAFPPQSMAKIIAEVLSDAGRTMLKTAETEKYPHVTYFFNGGNEPPYPGEERILVPSQKVATYDLAPEMSARGVTDVLTASMDARAHSFMLCNLANGDMVGHSGSLPATIQACEVVDACLARIVAAAERSGTRLLVTADHGNCELMIDPETGGPHTAHTTNPVPFVVVDPDGDVPLAVPSTGDAAGVSGALCDIAPTILQLLGLEKPSEMTGRALRAALVLGAVGVGLVGARGAAAQGGQIGYPASRSPFTDLEYNQSFTVLGGYFNAAKDPAGVAPQSGPLVGLQYDLGGGPAIFTTRVRTVFSDRTVLDPARPVATRVLGTEKRPLTMADLGLTLALTGARTYHGFVPLVHVGAGVVTNFGGADPGGFTFGTSFALAYGLGVRYVPSSASRYALRVDLGNSLYRVRYPSTYARPSTGYNAGTYVGTADSTSIVPSDAPLSRYRNNVAITAGVSYLFHR